MTFEEWKRAKARLENIDKILNRPDGLTSPEILELMKEARELANRTYAGENTQEMMFMDPLYGKD